MTRRHDSSRGLAERPSGQTVVLWFSDRDDGYAGDPTYFLLDDVSLRGS
jgi:hypothetical protein